MATDKVVSIDEFNKIYQSAKSNDFEPMYNVEETHGVRQACRMARYKAPSGYGLLHQATYFMDLKAMSYLISRGASPDDTALDGKKPENVFEEGHFSGVPHFTEKIKEAKSLLGRARITDQKYAPPLDDGGLMPCSEVSKCYAIGRAPFTMNVYYNKKVITIPAGEMYVQDEFGRACIKDNGTRPLAEDS